MKLSILFRVTVVVLGMVALSSCVGIPDSKHEMNNVLENTSTAREIQDKIMVTPFGYKQVLLQNGETKVDCWICRNPCASTICCDDGWPQCCTWQGLCGCCSV